jgi:hypothetical protein
MQRLSCGPATLPGPMSSATGRGSVLAAWCHRPLPRRDSRCPPWFAQVPGRSRTPSPASRRLPSGRIGKSCLSPLLGAA